MSSSDSLTTAVAAGDENTVSALLAYGADVNETTNGGQSALILAVIFGHTNLIRMLMKAGADPHLRDNLGLDAVEWAKRRGLNEAYAILTNKAEAATRPNRIVIPVEETAEKPPAPRNDQVDDAFTDEKSRRWLAGVKQRLDEQAMRRLNRNEPPLEPRLAREEEPPPPPPPPSPSVSAAPRIFTPPPDEPAKTGKRKRCPQCNTIYNGDLLSYCAHHVVPLVDIDEPVITEKPKSNGALFWILLIVTLAGSVVAGSLVTMYVYKANQPPPVAAEPPKTVQNGKPEVGTELAGKVISLPEAECPIKAEPVSGTVTVRIAVDKNGQVTRATGSGGDWLMRGCSTEAAMKSTFDPQKLRSREVEGTITYTFKP